MKKRLYILAIAIFMICNNVSAIYELASDTTGYIPSTDTTAVVPPAPEIPDTSDVIPPNVPDTGTVAPPPAEPSAPSIEGRKVVEYPHVVASGKKQQMSLSLEGNNLRVKGQIWAQGTKEHYLDYQIMADSAYICRVDMDYKNTKAYLLDIDVLIPGFAGDKYKVTFEALDVSLSATDEAKQRKTMLIERGNYAAQPEMENTFLVDGKSWNYSKVMLSDKGDKIEEQFSITVRGDTLFENRWCKSLVYSDGDKTILAGVAYETEDGKVNIYNTLQMDNAYFLHEGWMCAHDFGLHQGDKVPFIYGFEETPYIVGRIDSIDVKGEIRKRWNAVVEESDTCAVFSVVEGIGNSKYGIYAFCSLDPDRYPLYYFVSCYQGNRCIFEAKDFNLNTWSDSYVSIYIPQSTENDSLNTLEHLLTDNQKEKVVGLAIYGYPKTSDFEYLRYNLLPQLERLDLCHAEVDTMPERAFDVTLPENNATTKYIVLPKTLTHLSDNALCIYPNKVTYEITGKYPSLGKNIYSHEGRPSNNIFVVPSQGNKYLTLHTIDPTGGSSGPERGLLPMKQTKEEGDSLGGSVVVSMDGDTLYYVNPTACHKYAIPQNITRIHSNAMENKRLQASFNIPESVDFIGDRAFYGLQIVQTRNSSPVYYMSCSKNTPPLIGNEVFDESSLVTGNHVFYVNKESISDYKNTKGWDKLYYGDIDDVSGIEEVKTAKEQSPYYYDLQGRRLINPTKGLYIHNGKKVIVK